MRCYMLLNQKIPQPYLMMTSHITTRQNENISSIFSLQNHPQLGGA